MANQRLNTLHSEKSPYLLQHKDNPIAWLAWGEEAFDRARDEHKPVFLSVGYSTCHWCHVMAHESFEDQEVAQVLNDKFICIKVDREERPDVDDVYMKALQTLTGGGGWPMSIWMTSEGKPFFAGTYFPKFRFLQLLRRIDQLWTSETAPLLEDSERLMKAVRDSRESDLEEGSSAGWEEALSAYTSHVQHHYDDKNGGFGGAPKFPQSMNLMLMMRQDSRTGLNQAEAMVTGTLNKMLRGGIYDQLAGGFHRYSVDDHWLVPHFEKMLYDQALITLSMVEAMQIYQPQPELKRAVRETCDYVLREMTHPEGGFFSAQDADSLDPKKGHKEEGYFATYDYEELKSILSAEELSELQKVYGVSAQGDFEGRCILHLQDDFDGNVKNEPLIASALTKLSQLRASRPAPHLDDKVVGAWNGWMIWALAKAGQALNEPRYLAAAEKALAFARSHLWQNGKLARFWRDGEARGTGMAEDYASLVLAALELHQVNFDPSLVEWALQLQGVLDSAFWDAEDGDYFSNDGSDELLPVRPKDDYDGVTPSANSMAAFNLAHLHLLTGEPRFKSQVDRIFERFFNKFNRYPSGHAFMGMAADFSLSDAKVCVMNGDDWATDFYEKRRMKFQPHIYWTKSAAGWPVAADKVGTTPAVHVCLEGRCLKPAQSTTELEKQLSL